MVSPTAFSDAMIPHTRSPQSIRFEEILNLTAGIFLKNVKQKRRADGVLAINYCLSGGVCDRAMFRTGGRGPCNDGFEGEPVPYIAIIPSPTQP